MSVTCDWCGAEMRWLGPVVTGMLKGHATVYRCTRDRCSREREVIHRWGKWRDIKLARQRYRLLRVLSARHKELFYQRLLDVWERL